MMRSGEAEERTAAKFLKQKGYKIIEQNFRCPLGEIDIIAEDHGTLCFVEVKSRTYTQFGFPMEAVNHRKQKKIARLAAYYLQSKKMEKAIPCRFDVIAIVPDKPPEIYSDAFWVPSS